MDEVKASLFSRRAAWSPELQQALSAILDVFNADTPTKEELAVQSGNPFEWLQDHLKYAGLTSTFGIQLQVLFGFIGLTAILAFATLFLQYRQRNVQPKAFWFFRRHYHTQSKTAYLVPHPINTILGAIFLTSLYLLGYLAYNFYVWRDHLTAKAIRTASWFPSIWLTFFAAVWLSGFGSLYLTFLSPAQFTRRASLTGVQKRLGPVLVNGLCFGVPILVAATILPLQVEQSNQMRYAMRHLEDLNVTVSTLAISWVSQNSSTTQDQIGLLLRQAGDADHAKQWWDRLWTAEMAIWSIWTLLAMAVAVPFSLRLVLSTHRRIRRMATTSTRTGSGPELAFDAHSSSDGEYDILKSPSTAYSQSIKSPVMTPSPSHANLRQMLPAIETNNVNLTSKTLASPLPSTVTTPAAKEYWGQPFFPSSNSGILASPASMTPLRTGSQQLAHHQHTQSHHSMRPSLNAARRISSYAIFPGRTSSSTALSQDDRAELIDLHKRYWHVVSQYLTVFVLMASLSAFALYEAASSDTILTNCERTNVAVVVTTFAYGLLVSVWLVFNLHRLLTTPPPPKIRSSPTITPRSSGILPKLSAYTLSSPNADSSKVSAGVERREAHHSKHSSDTTICMESYGPLGNRFDPLDNVRDTGLRIEIDRRASTQDPLEANSFQTHTPAGHSATPSTGSSSNRPTPSRFSTGTGRVEFVRQDLFERRRSSFRGASMDLSEALAMPHWLMEGRRGSIVFEE